MNERHEALAALEELARWADKAARENADAHGPENVERMKAKLRAIIFRAFPPLENEDIDPVGEMRKFDPA